jgi:hypothetical protein
MDDQSIIQSTPAIFSFTSWTTDVVITVEKVRAPNAGRRSGAPNMYWPHLWWLNQAVERGVDRNERWLYAALINHCVDYSVAESHFYVAQIPAALAPIILVQQANIFKTNKR